MLQEKFTIQYTNVAKGIAIVMLLIHHLFYDYNPDLYTDIMIFYSQGKHFGLFNIIAYICKTTVWIFVILSGYGLFKSYKNNLFYFYKKHYLKLYSNYWFIWLCFVPFGVLVLHRTFESVYGTANYLPYLMENILGVQMFFKFWGYNPTWWFMSLIIFLYAIFPIIYFITSIKSKIIHFIILSAVAILTTFKISIFHFNLSLNSWDTLFIFPFLLGVFLAKYEIFEKVKDFCRKSYRNYILLFILILLSILRFAFTFKYVAGDFSPFDTLLAYSIIQYAYNTINLKTFIADFFILLGNHSFNIFLFHTFIFGIYFSKYVYCFKYPILILPVFICYCILISTLLEKIKSIIRKFISYVSTKLIKQ